MATPSLTERRQDAEATRGNVRVHVAALTAEILRQGSSLMTIAEAREQALRLYRAGRRAEVR
jgi:hypothetical protein